MTDQKEHQPPREQRFWEIDFLRGLSILLMVGFHFVYDFLTWSSETLGLRQLNLPLYLVWQRTTAILFLLLVGVSLTLSGAGRIPQPPDDWNRYRPFLIRGGRIFAFGLAITLITRLYLQSGYVVFGVLHLIGLAVMVSYPFLKLSYWNLAWGAAAIGVGIWINHYQVSFPWLVWVGLAPENFFSVDYFPFFPWFGLVLWGIFVGNTLYRKGQRRLRLPEKPPHRFMAGLCFLGRKSLLIYLVHQPILLFLLSVLKGNRGFD